MSLLNEIQAAQRLGFQLMADFERALCNQEVPGPVREIRNGRRKIRMWSDKEIDEWIEGGDPDTERKRKDADIAGLVA